MEWKKIQKGVKKVSNFILWSLPFRNVETAQQDNHTRINNKIEINMQETQLAISHQLLMLPHCDRSVFKLDSLSGGLRNASCLWDFDQTKQNSI